MTLKSKCGDAFFLSGQVSAQRRSGGVGQRGIGSLRPYAETARQAGRAMPADGAAGSNAEAGLSQAQIRANNVAKKYRESQEREMARKRRSGNVWMGVALINAVRRPPLSHA